MVRERSKNGVRDAYANEFFGNLFRESNGVRSTMVTLRNDGAWSYSYWRFYRATGTTGSVHSQ
jgi:hypothetical protein